MKTTRIEIEGPLGTASIHREGRWIIISGSRVTKVIEKRNGEGMPVSETFELKTDSNIDWIWQTARKLQEYLDGYRGANGDVREYQRVIETFAD